MALRSALLKAKASQEDVVSQGAAIRRLTVDLGLADVRLRADGTIWCTARKQATGR